MGSAKFPDENSYDAFLSAHAGSSNAYTELVRCSNQSRTPELVDMLVAPDLTWSLAMHGAWQALHVAAQGACCPMPSARAGSSRRVHPAGVLEIVVQLVWCSLAKACLRLAACLWPESYEVAGAPCARWLLALPESTGGSALHCQLPGWPASRPHLVSGQCAWHVLRLPACHFSSWCSLV